MEKLAENLKNALQISRDENEFPDYLAVQVLDIANNIEKYSSMSEMILELIFMISDYNIYAETCCGELVGTSEFQIKKYLKKF